MIETITADVYSHMTQLIIDQTINLTTADIRAALFTDAYTFNAAHTTWGDIVANEISGTGYTSGGQAITHTGNKWEYNAGTGIYTFGKNANNILWDNSTFIADFIIIYIFEDDGAGSPLNTSLLIGSKQFGEQIHTNNGSFTIVWNEVDGIFRIKVGP